MIKEDGKTSPGVILPVFWESLDLAQAPLHPPQKASKLHPNKNFAFAICMGS